jgi:hypothetical protein
MLGLLNRPMKGTARWYFAKHITPAAWCLSAVKRKRRMPATGAGMLDRWDNRGGQLMVISFGLDSSAFGTVTVRTPSRYAALIFSALTMVGNVKER